MADDLVELMNKFSAAVRRYRGTEIGRIAGAMDLTERDIAILEFVSKSKNATFGEIARTYGQEMARERRRAAVSQAISSLYAKRGLVDKRANPSDQRQPIVTLTRKGLQAAKRIQEVQLKILQEVRAAMKPDPDEEKVLNVVFERGYRNFENFLANQ